MKKAEKTTPGTTHLRVRTESLSSCIVVQSAVVAFEARCLLEVIERQIHPGLLLNDLRSGGYDRHALGTEAQKAADAHDNGVDRPGLEGDAVAEL